MRFNIELDDKLIKEAFCYTDVTTMTNFLTLALSVFVENHRRRDIRDLKGKIKIDPDYNYKKLR